MNWEKFCKKKKIEGKRIGKNYRKRKKRKKERKKERKKKKEKEEEEWRWCADDDNDEYKVDKDWGISKRDEKKNFRWNEKYSWEILVSFSFFSFINS